MANDVKITIQLREGEILNIDKFKGLKSIETLSQSNGQPKEVFYGIVPSDGSAEILDIDGKIEKFIKYEIIPNNNMPLNILCGENVIQSHISIDSDYNSQNKILSLELSNELNGLQNVKIKNQKYPIFSYSDNRSIIVVVLIECLKLLGLSEDYILDMLNDKIFYGYGKNIKYGTIFEYLNLISLPGGFAYTSAKNAYDAINEICTIAQLNLIKRDDGSIRFIQSRPIASLNERIISIPLSNQILTLQRDVLLKNKYNNVRINKNVITRTRSAILNDTYSVRDDNGNLDISSVGNNAILVSDDLGNQYICFFVTINSAANMLRTKGADGSNEIVKMTSIYNDSTTREVVTQIVDSTSSINDFIFTSDMCTRLTQYSTLQSETFAVRLPITTGAHNSSPLEQINLKIYSSEFTISSKETLLNSNNNIYEFSNSDGLLNSELYCSDYGYGRIQIYDMIANNIVYDYSNGITTASTSVVCANYYDTNGNLAIDWSKGEILQVGDIVQINKDNIGTSAVENKKGEPMRFKVTGRTFRKIGVPIVDLELQEVKLVDYTITSKSFAEDNWSTIDEISRSGKASEYYSVGDKKQIYVSGREYTFVILGFNHDDLADGSGKAGITIGMENLKFGYVQMDNSSPYTNIGGWAETTMRNVTLPQYFDTMSEDLRSVIKTVNKLSSSGGLWTENITTTQDKLWLLSRVEIDGKEGDSYSLGGEGSQYEYWKIIKDGSLSSNRIKYGYQNSESTEPTVAHDYFLRSAYQPSDTNFVTITKDGYINSSSASAVSGVSFCFCV